MKYLVVSILFLVAQSAFPQNNDEVVPGEFLVELQPQLTESGIQTTFAQLEEQFGISLSHRLPNSEIYLFKQKNPELMLTSEKIKTARCALTGIAEIEANLIFRVNRVPNDPQYSAQWSLKNRGEKKIFEHKGIDINVEPAWDLTTGSRNLVVAIVDSGINYLHPDLRNNIWINSIEKNGRAGVDDDKNGFVDDIFGYDFANKKPNAMDDLGHGSHCAGIIGAKGNNNFGMAGINWNIRLMPVKFLNKNGSGTLENALNAINYASRNGARIINASWGSSGTSHLIEKAIAKLNEKNILFVAAAGNERSDNDKKPIVPGSIVSPNLISVAAIDDQADLASFSNYGLKSVHIGAPGVNILSTVLEDKYEFMSGTSMAAPFISGVCALLMAHNPKLKPSEIKANLLKSAFPLEHLRNKVSSQGMVDAFAAFGSSARPIEFE